MVYSQDHCKQPILLFLASLHELSAQAPDGTKNIAVGSPIAIIGETGRRHFRAADMASNAMTEASHPVEEAKISATPPLRHPRLEPSKASESEGSELTKGDRIFASPIAKKNSP